MNIPNLQQGISKILEPRKKPFPVTSNWCSALDDPCIRKLYYMRTAWDKVGTISDSLAGIFETGSELEPVIERILSQIGPYCDPPFRIIGQQLSTKDSLFEEYQIGGKIDGLLQVRIDGRWITLGVIDIKTSSPHVFTSLSDYDSLSRYPWTRKYRGQLMLYSLAHGYETAFILAVNKSNLFDMKLIVIPVDMGYCDRLLATAKTVNEAVQNQNPPAKLNDPDVCPTCPYQHLCLPEYSTGTDCQISTDTELEEILLRLDDLKEMQDQIKDLEKRRDQILSKGHDVICGSFLITWTQIERKGYSVPAGTTWRKSIVRHETSQTHSQDGGLARSA